MELILWRHADAEDGLNDIERRLTQKGIEQAARMAKWLHAHLPEDAAILVSPARRAQQTARELTPNFKTVPELGLAASATGVLLTAGWPDSGGTVVIVGHQPTLGEALALLLTDTVQPWDLKKGAVVWVARRDGESPGRTQLRAAISPDLL
jgi:phosphohistidine phosphatase